jgi:hypothetical protein
MKKILISFSIVLIGLFSGCGGGSSSSTPPQDDTVTMVLNTTYTMTAGGSISKTSTDANIEISTSLDSNSTTVKLTSGSATCEGCTVLP